ncbi:MAG: NAD(P)/FAD-dependent oxidoreductase [Candidatus Marinimicrobia bacterium]|nr:NAD(P)/FAD-dependent oxidoreductase [Candidatus Neomarinimicrobiota bacterium]
MTRQDIIIVGAGPAGLIAAGKLGKAGYSVTLLEKMEQTGKKLRMTGKGRCNVTNSRPKSEFINAFGKNGKFLHSAFSRFFSNDLVAFFQQNLHIDLMEERGGRIFPVSQNAHEIADKLTQWATQHHVTLLYNHQCVELLLHNNRIQAIKCKTPNGLKTFETKAVLLSTGGTSYPSTGSSGDGYLLAQQAGHTIIPPLPALVPLTTKESETFKLSGLSIKNAQVTVFINNKPTHAIFGEFLFTHFGLSGPVILTLSRDVVENLQKNKAVYVEIDFKPALTEKVLDARLIREFVRHHNKKLKNIMPLLLPEALGMLCLEQTGVLGDMWCHSVPAADRKKLVQWMKHFRLTITGYRSLEEAIVTHGGVCLKEVDPITMQSKIVSNLFFAGELLDLDADTGGYNLQAAFSTGWCAAEGMLSLLTQL